MQYKKAKIKLRLELLLMSPFVLLGKLIGNICPLKKQYDLFLFFPNADIGGSPKVNLDIIDCMKNNKRCLLIFSKKPNNNQFADRFKETGIDIIDLHKRIDHKLFHFVNFYYRGVIASWINKRKEAVVFGGECMFFYKIVPHVRQEVKVVELSHLATWIHYNIAFIDRIDMRVFSTQKLMQDVKLLYTENQLPEKYFQKLFFLDNSIAIAEPLALKKSTEPMEVIFVGRGSAQKRPELIAQIAKVLFHEKLSVHFSFIGDVEKVFDIQKYPFCKFYGNIKSEEDIQSIYKNSDVLILTSAFEGLPIVVMQMMAYGKPVISTAVDGIPDYIQHGFNGLLITATNEDEIVAQGVQLVKELLEDPDLRVKLGAHSRERAISLFSKQVFCKNYNRILTY